MTFDRPQDIARGLREAGRPFAIPTYFFTFMVVLLIVVGVVREIFGDLPRYHPEQMAGTVTVHHGSGLVMGASISRANRTGCGTSRSGSAAPAGDGRGATSCNQARSG